MALPLQNIRVLDFTHLLPGELCSTILADLGCEVTRVESLQPRLAQQLPPIVKGESLYYWSLHRNKQRMAVDLKNAQGVEIVRKLAGSCDVVLENFRPGVMNRLGIGYDALAGINERLVYCSISGYGQNSSMSQRPGHDLNFIAEAGVLGLSTQSDGRPNMPGILVADYTSASYAALSVVSALFEREKNGKGRHLDIGMFHCTLSTINILATVMMYTGEQPGHGRPGFQDEMANYTIYCCKDKRYIAVAALEPQFWQVFCQRIGLPQLADKTPRAGDVEIQKLLNGIFGEKTLDEWMVIFEGSDCCVSAVNSIEEALSFAPAQERGMVTHMPHPVLDKVPQLRTPTPFCENNGGLKQTVPQPAQQSTIAILEKLGYTSEQIEQLASAKVIPAQTGTATAV
jgi:crotonobetainyl-CoA:carnitine CoA-transferase CaiB-like acyl-CoA transferase